MFTLLKVVGERARSPTTFVMITNQKCQLYQNRCFAFPSMKTAQNVDGRRQKQFPSMKRAVFVDGNARSMRSEPFGVARAACFEQLAGVFTD